MEEYKVSDGMFNELLERAEELGWSSSVWKESDGRTYVEMEKYSPEGEDFSMLIDFKEEDATDSFVRELREYYEGFDADAIDKMIEELADDLEEVNSQMRYDYREIKTEKVEVKGIPCEFYDMRIARDTVPDGKFQYEVAGDDDSGADPARIQRGVMVNFYGTIVCDQELPLGEDNILWVMDGDFVWKRG